MIQVISFKPNSFSFSEGNSRESIKDSIKDIVVVHEVLPADMMELVVEITEMKPEDFGDTIICRETGSFINQVCYKSHIKNQTNDEELNCLATFLTLTRQKIHGSAVFIKSTIDSQGMCQHDSSTIDDIVEILFRKVNHIGIILKTNNTIEEFNFKDNPISYLNSDDQNNLQFIEMPFLKFNLVAGIEKAPKNNKINKLATKLSGKHRVHGDVILLSRIDEHEYDSLEKDTIESLLIIASKNLSSRELTDEEKNVDKVNDLPIVKNKYTILTNRLKTHQDRCNRCLKKININEPGIITCTGCYRIFYDTNECRLDDWQYHKDECLFKKQEINIALQNK